MHGAHQHLHVFGRGVLADAVAQIEDVTTVRVRQAKLVQGRLDLALHSLWAGEQDGRIELAL